MSELVGERERTQSVHFQYMQGEWVCEREWVCEWGAGVWNFMQIIIIFMSRKKNKAQCRQQIVNKKKPVNKQPDIFNLWVKNNIKYHINWWWVKKYLTKDYKKCLDRKNFWHVLVIKWMEKSKLKYKSKVVNYQKVSYQKLKGVS